MVKMALNLEESKELETLKQKHKKECYEHQEKIMTLDHKQKMERLEQHIELAKLNYRFGGE
jgi:hypothetical protein